MNITFKTVKPNLIADIKANITPMLLGEPGIGKSAELKHIAHDEFNTKIFILTVNQLGTREDLTGVRSIKDEKTNTYRQIFFPHASVQDAIDYAKSHPDETPLLFLDEINRATPDVTSACLQLITERRIGTTQLPSNIRIVAAGNDKGNINNLDDANITRMAIYHVVPDTASYLDAMQDKLNWYVLNTVKSNPALLVDKASSLSADIVDDDTDDDDSDSTNFNFDLDDNSFTQMTVPRTIEYASNYLTELGLDHSHDTDELNTFRSLNNISKDEDNILYQGLIAHLGETEFANQLYNLIESECNSINNNANNATDSYTIPTLKVSIIDNLISMNDRDHLEEYINDELSDKDKLTLTLNVFDPKFVQKIQNLGKVETIIDILTTDDTIDLSTIDTNTLNKFSVDLTNFLSQSNPSQFANATYWDNTDSKFGNHVANLLKIISY